MVKNKKDTNKYWILVPQVGSAVPNIQIMAYQNLAVVENGIQVKPAQIRVLEPNGQGLFTVDSAADDFEVCKTRLEQHMEFVNKEGQSPRMLGPFNTITDAFEAMHKSRPKTDAELASESQIMVQEKQAQLKAKDQEIAELRKKIADAGKANSSEK